MKIVCASSVLFAREAFETLGETSIIPDRQISPENLHDADMLIVRSKTNVTADLLRDTRITFVGTATAGTDHMDTDFLDAADIAWCAAPGCNANSVAEYVAAALCKVGHRFGISLDGKTIGVIGCGQVGSRVIRKAQVLGLRVLANDPPLEFNTHDGGYASLDQVLAESDIITFHVPLTKTGRWPTFHMANCHFFEHLRPGCLVINAARGEVVDTENLIFAIDRHAVTHAVLDTWEDEPAISPDLLRRVDIATPHIAGYSFEGRLNGTIQVYNEACHFCEVEPTWVPDEVELPPAAVISCRAEGRPDESVLHEIIRGAYDIEKDDSDLRQCVAMTRDARSTHFDSLRRSYSARREFPCVTVKITGASPQLVNKIAGLGFKVLPS